MRKDERVDGPSTQWHGIPTGRWLRKAFICLGCRAFPIAIRDINQAILSPDDRRESESDILPAPNAIIIIGDFGSWRLPGSLILSATVRGKISGDGHLLGTMTTGPKTNQDLMPALCAKGNQALRSMERRCPALKSGCVIDNGDATTAKKAEPMYLNVRDLRSILLVPSSEVELLGVIILHVSTWKERLPGTSTRDVWIERKRLLLRNPLLA